MSYQVDSYGNAYFPAGVSVASIPATTGTQSRVLVPGPGGRISSASISQLITQSGGNLVTSVYGRTGAVVPRQGDYDTDLVTEGQALYFTNDRARKSISVTTFNTSGPATYDSTTGIINIPQYGSGIVGNYVPVTRTITINGQTADLSANRIFSIDSMVYPSAGIPLSNGTSWGTSIVNNSANWNTAFGWGNHAGLYSLLGHTHTFASLTSIPTTLAGYGITDAATSAQGTKADTAFSWGNHALAGYLTSFTETDPTVASYIKAITTTNIANWNSAHSWGNHALAGYLTSFTETDPIWTSEKINYYTKLQADARYLQSYTETDPVWTSEKVNYYTKTAADARYLQSYTETDPVWTSEKANYALKTYVDTSISNLVDSAPTTLNTLNELAAALGDDANFSTTITTLIGGKEPAITAGTTTQYWRGDKTWQTLPVYTLSGLGGEPAITAGTTSQYWRGDKTWQILPIYTLSGLGGQPQLNGTGFVKVTGTTVSYDNSTYLTTSSAASTYLPLTGGTVTGVLSVNSALRIKSGSATGILLETYSTNELRIRVTPVSTTFDMNLVFPSSSRTYTYPNATGTIALTSDIPTLSGLGGVPTTRTLTINGTSYDLSADRSWTISTGISGSGTTNYLSKWTGATSVGNSVAFDNGSAIGINTASPFESSAFKLDVNGGVIIKNTSGTAAQLILIDSNPATGGNNGFVQLSAGGNTATAFGQWQTYYGTSIASGTLRLQPAGGVVLVGSTTAVTGAGMLQVAGDVNITGTFRINGTPFSSGTSLNGTGFVKASGTTITYDNSTYYLASNPSGYITASHNHDGRYIRLDTVNEQDGIVAYFRPATSGGYTMMKFESKVNQASDYGWILMQDDSQFTNGAPGTEDIRMTIGVFNDFQGPGVHSDELWFQGGARLVQNVGSWDSEYTTIIGTSTAKTNGTTYEWRVNNSSVMAISFAGVLSVGGNTVYHAGNLTNLNQLSNGPGYITGYTETDTLSTVVARGSTTTATISVGNSSLGNTGINILRGRLSFSNSYEANHSIYNNLLNLDGLGAWDGMKMNVYLGLDIRTGAHDSATNILAVRSTGVVVTGTLSATNLSGTNTGDQTNISGNAATATNVAWTGVTGRPTALSSFTNDLGNYGGWVTSSGTVSEAYKLNYNGLGSATTNISSGQSQVLRNENGSGGNLSYAPVLHLAASDTMWQIQGDYYDSSTLRWRAGYAGTWYSWRSIYHSGNLTNLNQLTNGPGYITSYSETDTLGTVTGRGASTATAVTFSGGLNVAASKVGFRNAGLTEFIQGEAWTMGIYGYNSNDGFLFFQRDTSDVAHPCFHIGGWNNAAYGGYSNADSMITLVRGDGAKSEGSTYATRGLSSSSYYSNIIKTTGGTIFRDSQSSHTFTGAVITNGVSIHTPGDGGAGSQATVVAIRVRGLSGYESLELGTENNYDGVIRSYGNDIRYYAGHWRSVGNTSSENHSHYWYTSRNGSTDWSNHKMRLDHDGVLTVASNISTPGNLHANRSRLAFSSTATDANHSIYNNYNNIDGEGSFDGMKMNVYAGLLVRTGNASGAVPTTALDVTSTRTSIATGQLWCGASNSRDGAVGLVLNDGALHVRAHNDFYHKIWYYDGIAFGTNSAHGHFRFYAESSTQRGSTSGGATLRFDMDSTNGNFWAGGDVTAYSDARVKTDVKVIENSIEKIQAIRGVTFLRTDAQEQDKEKRHAGVIAQEVLEVMPEVVTENDEGMYSVAYGNIVALLIEGMKEQQTQIEELKNEIKELKNK